jgi:sugar phosphate isomerase/epimerase
MQTDLRDAMRVGIVHFMAYPSTGSGSGPILESLNELAADDYFDVVEVTHIEDPAVRKQAADLLQVAGMDIAFGSQPLVLGQKLNLHSRNREERDRALRVILGALEEAVEIGAVGFATMSGPIPPQEYRREETELFIDSLDRICERARQLKPDLGIVVETFDNVPFGKNCLVGPTAEAIALAEEVQQRYDNFGIMLDLSHLPMLGEKPAEALPLAAKVLRHAHIGNCVISNPNNPYYGDNHPPFGYPDSENGLEELIEYLRVLREIGYLNARKPPIVTIEVKPLNDAERHACLGNVKRNLNRALRRLNAAQG